MNELRSEGWLWNHARRALLFAAFLAALLLTASGATMAYGDDDFFPDAHPVSVAATCDGKSLQGSALIAITSAPGTLPVEAAVYLEYAGAGSAWIRTPGTHARQHAVVYGSSDWTAPFSVPLDGLPSTTTTVRAVVEVDYPDVVGGETLIASEFLESAAITCAPPAPDTSDPWTMRYQVRLGDTLASVAGRYGVSVDSVAATNGLGSDGALLVGQVLVVPPRPTPTQSAPASVGLGSIPNKTATPRAGAGAGAATATRTPTATATASPTATSTRTPATPSATPGSSPTPPGNSLAGPVVPGTGDENSGGDGNGGGAPFDVLGKLVPLVFVVISLVAAAGTVILFRIWREGRRTDEADIEAEPAVRVPRRAGTASNPAQPDDANSGAGGPSPLAALAQPADQTQQPPEEEPLPASLRDVFSKATRRSVFADVIETQATPTSTEVLTDAAGLVDALRRRRAG